MRRAYLLLGLLVPLVLAGSSLKGQTTEDRKTDDAFEAARKYVDESPLYMHHSKLKRGMKGYGLTVMAGTKIVKFDVEIISVITNWSPKRDVIFAMMSGQGLEQSGIIAGMSGSPVFMTDPADGKDKMIGAVAYGFRGQKTPQAGIQPITQMLAMSGIPQGKPFGGKDRPAVSKTTTPINYKKFILASLKPEKDTDLLDFIRPKASETFEAKQNSSAPHLMHLATPLMVSGINEKLLARLEKRLRPLGFIPMQSGGVGASDAEDAKEVKLERGSAISVPLVTGDADLSATGTVTEVIGDNVLAFGHSFFSEGPVEFPMGTAYIHTVVPGILDSFKLASTLQVTGELKQDEEVAVGGVIGEKVSTVPMTVTVNWKQDNRSQKFNYNIVRHHWWTPSMADTCIDASAFSWRDFPEFHTVSHKVAIDFGKLGKYVAENVNADSGTAGAYQDVIRPLAILLNNPYGESARVESIDVQMEIESQSRSAAIMKLQLDGRVYKPGDTITGKLTIRPFKQQRREVKVSFKLPDDIKEGQYSLAACDSNDAAAALVNEMPHLFDPKDLEGMMASLKELAAFRGDRLYLRLQMPQAIGLAIETGELPDLPESKAVPIIQSDKLDTKVYMKSLVRDVQFEYVLNGSAEATFEVQEKPQESRVDKQRNQ